jgi:hypothetical protein
VRPTGKTGEYSRTMKLRPERAEVLVTVKTTPVPSVKYNDTVCVAGIRIDCERTEWIRLYPIKFRWLDLEEQFKKYDVISVDVRRRTQDTRPESYSPDQGSIMRLRHLDPWLERVKIIDKIGQVSACRLSQQAGNAHDGPSLGLVPVADLNDLVFIPHPGWTADEQAKIRAAYFAPAADLFGERGHTPPPLIAPRFKVKYQFRCESAACPGHECQMLDWELTELQRREQERDDTDLKDAIRQRFLTQMWNTDRCTAFYMGNFEAPKKRRSFSVLGAYYPRRSEINKARAAAAVLF